MTTKGEWVAYTGSDEQIAEIGNSINANGFITKNISGLESSVVCTDTTHYWIIPDDPLREMKIRQAQTGKPVWIRMDAYKLAKIDRSTYDIVSSKSEGQMYTEHTIVTTTPDWNIPNAEYSFTAFEE